MAVARTVAKTLAVIALVLVALAAGLLVLVQTETGKRIVGEALNRVLARSDDIVISIEGLGGQLPLAPTFTRIVVADQQGTWLVAEQVAATWHPSSLMGGLIDIDTVDAAHVRLLRLPEDDDEPDEPPPRALRRVWVQRLRVDALTVADDLLVVKSEREPTATVLQATGGYHLHRRSLQVTVELAAGKLAGSLVDDAQVGSGPVHIEARADGSLTALKVEADATMADPSRGKLDARELVASVTGTLAVARDTEEMSFEAEATVTAEEPRLEAAAIDVLGATARLSVDMRIEKTGEQPLELRLKQAQLASAHLQANGDVVVQDPSRTLTGNLRAEVDDLATLSSLAGIELTGSVGAEATLDGTLEQPGAEVSVVPKGLRIASGPPLDGRLEVDVLRLTDAPHGRLSADLVSDYGAVTATGEFALEGNETLSLDQITVKADGVSLAGNADIGVASGLVDGELTGRAESLRALTSFLGAEVSGSGELGIRLAAVDGEQRIDASLTLEDVVAVRDTTVAIERLRAAAKMRALGRRAEGEIHLEANDVRVAGATLAALRGDAEARAGVWNLRLATDGDYREKFRLTVGSTIDVSGDAVSASVHSLDGSVGRHDVALEREARVVWRDGSWTIEDVHLAVGGARLQARAVLEQQRIDATFELAALPLDLIKLYDPAIDVGGTLAGRATVSGSRVAPDLDFELASDAIVFGASQRTALAPMAVEAKGILSPDRFTISGTVRGERDTTLRAHLELPRRDLAAGASAAITGQLVGAVDLGLFNGLALLGEDTIGGNLHADLALSGEAAYPRISGELTIANGRYENAAIGLRIESVDARLIGNGSRLELDRFQANDGAGGTFDATGDVDLSAGLTAVRYRLELGLRSARVAAIDTLTAAAGGTVALAGEGRTLGARGKLTVERANVNLPRQLPPEVVALEVVEENVGAVRDDRYEAPPPPTTVPISLDLEVTLPGRVFVRGQDIDTEWKGVLHITGTSANPLIDGELELVRGVFTLVNIRLKAVKGRIEFDGAKEIDPILEVVGEGRKHGITALVTVTGRASEPKVSLSSEPELPEDEILSRLMFGRNPGELSAMESVQLATALARLTGRAPAGTDPLAWLRQTLHVDTLAIDEADTEEGGSVLSVGKYVADRVYLGVNQGLGETGTSASVELEVTPNLSLNSEIGTAAHGSLGLDWHWHY